MEDWCREMEITPIPRLQMANRRRLSGCDAVTEFFTAAEFGWRINIAKGPHLANPEVTMAHELLHVKTGCTDYIHEPWIRSLAEIMVRFRRATA